MDRMDNYSKTEPIEVRPMKTFPIMKDLTCDVSWNYEVNKKIPAFKPEKNTDWRFSQEEADRVQEFRKCIEYFLCRNVCHVLRDHQQNSGFGGPRLFVRLAGLEMHPLDDQDRSELIKSEMRIGYCNITKCCPESIAITDNAIIPLKERIVDRYYDPVMWLWRTVTGKK